MIPGATKTCTSRKQLLVISKNATFWDYILPSNGPYTGKIGPDMGMHQYLALMSASP